MAKRSTNRRSQSIKSVRDSSKRMRIPANPRPPKYSRELFTKHDFMQMMNDDDTI